MAFIGRLGKEGDVGASTDGRRGVDRISISVSDSDVPSSDYSSVSSLSSSSCPTG